MSLSRPRLTLCFDSGAGCPVLSCATFLGRRGGLYLTRLVTRLQGPHRVIALDLTHVLRISRAGLSYLVALHERLRETRRHLRVLGVSPAMHRRLRARGLHFLLPQECAPAA